MGLKAELTDDVAVLLRWVHAETDDPTTQLANAYVDKSGGAGFFDRNGNSGKIEDKLLSLRAVDRSERYADGRRFWGQCHLPAVSHAGPFQYAWHRIGLEFADDLWCRGRGKVPLKAVGEAGRRRAGESSVTHLLDRVPCACHSVPPVMILPQVF